MFVDSDWWCFSNLGYVFLYCNFGSFKMNKIRKKNFLYFFFKNDDVVNFIDFWGIIMYVWNVEIGVFE